MGTNVISNGKGNERIIFGFILKIYKWYRRHEKLQWALIIVPLWLQIPHMWGMGEMTLIHHEIIQSTNIAHYSFWGDMFLLLIDHLEWISIIVSTEKFIHWIKSKKRHKHE